MAQHHSVGFPADFRTDRIGIPDDSRGLLVHRIILGSGRRRSRGETLPPNAPHTPRQLYRWPWRNGSLPWLDVGGEPARTDRLFHGNGLRTLRILGRKRVLAGPRIFPNGRPTPHVRTRRQSITKTRRRTGISGGCFDGLRVDNSTGEFIRSRTGRGDVHALVSSRFVAKYKFKI